MELRSSCCERGHLSRGVNEVSKRACGVSRGSPPQVEITASAKALGQRGVQAVTGEGRLLSSVLQLR